MTIQKFCSLFVLFICIGYADCSLSHAFDDILGEDLRDRIVFALTQEDLDKFLEAYYLEGADRNAATETIKAFYSELVKRKDANIKVIPLDNDYKPEVLAGNHRFRPNLEAVGFLSVEYTLENGGYYLNKQIIGEINGSYYVAGIIKEALPSELWNLAILSYSVELDSPNQITTRKYITKDSTIIVPLNAGFKGYCEFTSNGNIHRVEIQGDDKASNKYDGQHFQYCEVHNLTNKGVIKLTLKENSLVVFEQKSAERSLVFVAPTSTSRGPGYSPGP
ncbi:hypothetical protein KI811_08245 [Geobacter hydrogenophilus]|uniref:Uncharacterized protein n=1 Tax=Geobacter hydrogenophilus TaxID=40983 RepID=A0A9W6LC33_9BACT|nr:hypothetical protein [Geobacter hydrogenophilus]MBT0893801.1 hypothetical protein [Geobacter hydrogenophilus]GLI37500.1 hypothetical protein GHYDROH2_10010 [Geobacter hydrogenophilus]